MKIEWGKKISCPACAMKLYDLMRTTIICPHCGNKFEEGDVKASKRKISTTSIEETLKTHINFEFSDEEIHDEENSHSVIEEDEEEIDSEIIFPTK